MRYLVKVLEEGKEVQYRPRGNSMSPKINSGDLVVIKPITSDLRKGDIVLCKVGRSYYIHLISAIRDKKYQISNNKGFVNGWVGAESIFGRVYRLR